MNKLNKFSRAIVAIAMMLTVGFPSFAHDFEVDGFYYNITNETEKSVAVSYKGSSISEVENEYTGCISIPESISYNSKTYSVTSIGYAAFYKCSGLTSVTIPNSVTSIGSSAFRGCTGLTSVTIPNSVISIGNYAFQDCPGLTSVTIPDSVTSIGNDAFHGCTGLTSVIIPNLVTSLGESTFSGCTGLTSVIIPNSVTSIGKSAFSGCKGLTSVIIPNSVTSIGNYAFSGCTGLTEVTFNAENCTKMGSYTCYVFLDCSNITKLIIGDKVKTIPANAFYGCSGLTSVRIPNSVTSIGGSAFYGCASLTSVIIPNSVTSIGNHAFSACSSLTEVTIGNSVTSIGEGAFSNTAEIKDVFYKAINCNSINDVWLSCDNNFIISKEVTNIPDNLNSDWQLGNVIISLPTTPPTCGPNSFTSRTKTKTTLYVPKDCYAAYWSAPVWQDFTTIKGIEQVATAISLPESMELTLNNSVKIEATLTPTNTTITTLYWETSNPEVATVDQEGNVTAVANGKATITAMTIDGSELSASCEVKIGVQDVESISISQKSAELKPNEMLNLSCSVIPENATNKAITWASDNTSIAVVRTNSDGSATVLAVAPGIAKIAATTNDGTNLSDTCVVKVLKLAETIALDKTSAVINTGETIDLKATVLPDDVDYKIVTWISSDEALATVKDNGDGTATVSAVNPGVVTITATTADGSNLSASCEVTITQLATAVTLDKTAISLPEGSSETITATVLPENASDKTIVWSTSDEAIATVTDNYDGTAVVTIVKVGVATITATTTDGSHLSATCEISGISGITNINSDGSDIEACYDVHGRLLSKPSTGINIIKMSDGSTRKEWVK